MKLKRWLSRGIVLAMVVALMVPMPVAAKSSNGGGKLVKSVTYYSQDSQTGRWLPREKTSYTYNKKNYVATEREDSYNQYFLGIPTSSEVTLYDYAYKFKGKTPKTLKVKNSVGTVVQTKNYVKGNVVRAYSTDNWSEVVNGVEKAGCSTSDANYAYDKNGFVSAVASAYVSVDPDGTRYDNNYRASYAWTGKKGVPTFVVEEYILKDGSVMKAYAKYNAKGLIVESGTIDTKTAAPTINNVYVYDIKKGLVKSVVAYSIDPVTKAPTATGMYKFSYTKTKISKARYSKMINAYGDTSSVIYNWN